MSAPRLARHLALAGSVALITACGGGSSKPKANRPPVLPSVVPTLSVIARQSASVTIGASDPDRNPLTYALVGSPLRGTVGMGSGGVVTYTHTAADLLGETLTYTVRDPAGLTSTGTVQVVITNRVPTATGPALAVRASSATVARSATVAITRADADGHPVTLSVVGTPTLGIATISGTTLTFAASAAAGTEQVVVRASDGFQSSTVAIPVTVAANRPPVAPSRSLTAVAGGTAAVLAAATDADGDPLVYAVATPPTAGTLAVDGSGRLIFDHGTATTVGSLSAVYRVTDIDGATATGPVQILVTNTPPTLSLGSISLRASSATVPRSAVASITRADADGHPVTLSVVGTPTLGVAAISGTTLTFAASAAAGTEQIIVRASDGYQSTTTAVPVTVAANRLPTAPAVSLTLPAGSTASALAGSTDPDGDPLVYAIAGQPATGALAIGSDGRITYDHRQATTTGALSGTYRVTDIDGGYRTGSVSITVTYIPPTVSVGGSATSGFEIRSTAGTGVEWSLSGGSVQDPITWELQTPPSTGSVTIDASGQVTYIPPGGSASGNVTFTVIGRTRYGVTAPIPFAVTVIDGNRVIVNDQTYDVVAGGTLTRTLSVDNPDADGITWSVVQNPTVGTAGFTAGQFTYIHTGTTLGTQPVTVRATDGQGFDEAVVRVRVTNQIPQAQALSRDLRTSEAAALTLAATDADGHPVTYQIVSSPTRGSLGAISGNQVTYTATGSAGADSFTYRAFDGYEYGPAATVTLTVRNNVLPVITGPSSTVSVTAGRTTNFTITGTDADSDPITYSVVSQPVRGSVGISGNTASFTHGGSAGLGNDSVTLVPNDGRGAGAAFTVPLRVVNSTPAATTRTAVVAPGDSVAITLAGTDGDGHSLTYAIASQPATGTLGSISSNQVTYTAAADATGVITFTYTASDTWSTSQPATVSVNVQTPFERVTVVENIERVSDVKSGDIDGDGDVDVVAVDPSREVIVIHENLGERGWSVTSFGVLMGDHLKIGLGDLNGDGSLDIAYADSDSSRQVLAYRLWDVSLNQYGVQHQVQGASASGDAMVAIGDLNGDGHLDLAVVSTYGGVQVALNGGSAQSWNLVTVLPHSGFDRNPRDLVMADITGDGELDLVDSRWTQETSTVYRNLGAGLTWGSTLIGTGLSSPQGIDVADVDNDGDRDVVVASSGDGTVSVLVNPGSASVADPAAWSEVQPITGLSSPGEPHALDIDNDGDLDFLIANYSANQTVLMRSAFSTGSFTFTTEPIPTATRGGNNPWSSALADIDGNPATIDLIQGYWSGRGLQHWQASGTAASWVFEGAINPGSYDPRSVVPGTLSDGPGMAIFDSALNQVSVQRFVTDADGRLGARTDVIDGMNASDGTFLDVDGDGVSDLFSGARLATASGAAWVDPVDVTNGFAAYRAEPIRIAGDSATGVAVLWNGDSNFYLYRNTGGTLVRQDPIPTISGVGTIAVTDLNADGRDDLIVANGTEVRAYLQPAVLTDPWTSQAIVTLNTTVQAILPRDVDAGFTGPEVALVLGDNTVRLARKGTLGWTTVSIDSAANTPVDGAWADIDDDGDADLVVLHQGANRVVWYENGNAWTLSQAAANLSGLQRVGIVDADEDGVDDVVVTRDPDYGSVEVLLNRVGGTGPAPVGAQ